MDSLIKENVRLRKEKAALESEMEAMGVQLNMAQNSEKAMRKRILKIGQICVK